MASQRLTDKSAIDNIGTGDLMMLVDVSDTTGSAEGTSVKMDMKHLFLCEQVVELVILKH
mgnify:CR=1 FL=1